MKYSWHNIGNVGVNFTQKFMIQSIFFIRFIEFKRIIINKERQWSDS